jgi:small subunit ribosomal protein S4
MGDPKKQRKKYSASRFRWSKDELEEQLRLLGEYGLRNKRELLKYDAFLAKFRTIARSLVGKSPLERIEAENLLIKKLFHMGLVSENANLDDVLDLTIEDFLKRRLQTIVHNQGLSQTPRQARQFIVHGHIAVNDNIVTVPSYLISLEEESIITYSKRSPFSNLNRSIQTDITAK